MSTPIKFLQTSVDTVNLVVVCISDILVGTAYPIDCILTMYGDPEVPAKCRLGVFGLFHETKAKYPVEIQELAKRFAHIRNTLHGVVFVFKREGAAIVNYELEQVTVWNRGLMDAEKTKAIMAEIATAIPPRK